MRIYALSRTKFNKLMVDNHITPENVELKTDVFFISINNTYDIVEPYFKENKDNVKVMSFDDVDEDEVYFDLETKKKTLIKAMTENQAQELFDFINKNKDKKTCIVHCTMGVSRSGGISQFIADYLNVDKNQFKSDNPQICPNNHVIRMLKKVSGL